MPPRTWGGIPYAEASNGISGMNPPHFDGVLPSSSGA